MHFRVCATACLMASVAAHAEAQAPLVPGRLPTLPLTQLDDRTLSADLDNRVFTLTFAQPVAIRDLLLLLVRGTSLSVVPDPGFSGTFIGELKNVTVRQALGLILPPLGLDYAVDGSIVRVFRREPETRLFDINYVAAARTGTAVVGAPEEGGTFARVSTTTNTDVFADLTTGVRTLLSERGTFNVDRKAGLLQVSDFPERLERVSLYLDAVHDRVHRQVQIDARVIEVELNDPATQSLDWELLAQSSAQTAGVPGSSRPAINGLRVSDVSRFMTALAAQGVVSLLANPRILVLNNEPAVVRAGSDGAGARGHEPIQRTGRDARRDAADCRGRRHHAEHESHRQPSHRRSRGEAARRFRVSRGRHPGSRRRWRDDRHRRLQTRP